MSIFKNNLKLFLESVFYYVFDSYTSIAPKLSHGKDKYYLFLQQCYYSSKSSSIVWESGLKADRKPHSAAPKSPFISAITCHFQLPKQVSKPYVLDICFPIVTWLLSHIWDEDSYTAQESQALTLTSSPATCCSMGYFIVDQRHVLAHLKHKNIPDSIAMTPSPNYCVHFDKESNSKQSL